MEGETAGQRRERWGMRECPIVRVDNNNSFYLLLVFEYEG
jgi:hypothetical protein